MRQHFDVAATQLEAQFGAYLEVAGQYAAAFRHQLQFFADRSSQRLPAGEVARVVLVAGQLLAQR
ncbi:hypothetical protein D3C72_2125000 [compost metagenome]